MKSQEKSGRDAILHHHVDKASVPKIKKIVSASAVNVEQGGEYVRQAGRRQSKNNQRHVYLVAKAREYRRYEDRGICWT